ncbi:cytochrome c3 family protein [Bradyrhizobium sp. Pha-3]
MGPRCPRRLRAAGCTVCHRPHRSQARSLATPPA